MRVTSALILGFAIGAVWMFFTVGYKKSIEPSDLVKSYEKGFQDALNAEKPSERLEAVCAALWLKGNEK